MKKGGAEAISLKDLPYISDGEGYARPGVLRRGAICVADIGVRDTLVETPESLPTTIEALVHDLLEVVDETHREKLTKSLRMAYALGYMVDL